MSTAKLARRINAARASCVSRSTRALSTPTHATGIFVPYPSAAWGVPVPVVPANDLGSALVGIVS